MYVYNCVYVYIYVCVYVCMCIYVYVYMYMYIYIYMYTCTYIHIIEWFCHILSEHTNQTPGAHNHAKQRSSANHLSLTCRGIPGYICMYIYICVCVCCTHVS